MIDSRYWIWLQNVIGIGENVSEILDRFKDPKTIYEADTLTLKNSGLFKKAQLDRKEELSLSVADKALNDCEKYGWKVVTPDSPFYPELLLETADYPLVLYVWGDEKVLGEKMHIGVIGTRKPSQYGSDVAYTLT
ncbi:MAG: DNA-processing protein DprA, partial [Acutalibacteraceae bacterium]